MVELSEFSTLLEELPRHRWAAEPVPPVPDIALQMPRVYRRPRAPAALGRERRAAQRVLRQASQALRDGNGAEFGKAYGQLCSLFQPGLQWARGCWDYLLTTHGCRFLPRTDFEKLYNRGDYRVFTENDFEGLVYRTFKDCLRRHVERPEGQGFERFLRKELWTRISGHYRALENPADPSQRKLTAYSYLRCVPYRFLNRYHDRRVHDALRRLPFRLRQPVELYNLSFCREEAASALAQVESPEFQRRRSEALRAVARSDYLSYVLLRQIERY